MCESKLIAIVSVTKNLRQRNVVRGGAALYFYLGLLTSHQTNLTVCNPRYILRFHFWFKKLNEEIYTKSKIKQTVNKRSYSETLHNADNKCKSLFEKVKE